MRTSHRDRNGLTFPTSLAKQNATPERSLRYYCGWRLAESEVRAVSPHSVHDDSQLSGYRHARLLRADFLGELYAPRSQYGPLFGDPQMRVRRLVEGVSHQLISALADMTRTVDLSRLVDTRRQTEMCGHRLGILKPLRIVYGGFERKAHDRSYAGDGHQTLADIILARHKRKLTVQQRFLCPHRVSYLEQRLNGHLQFWRISQQGFDLRGETRAMDEAELEAVD